MGRYKAVRAFAMAAAALVSSAGFAQGKGEFMVPGTNTKMKIYGSARVDFIYDIGGRADYDNADWATMLWAVPPDNVGTARRPQFYLTARASRFGFETTTPISQKYGPLVVKIEGDFNLATTFGTESYANSVAFRLRHAYGSYAGLLVGQTWSTFLDLAALTDTADFNGTGSIALARSPQVRYTYKWKNGLSIAVAAEYSRGAQFRDAAADARFQTVPDFHANLTYNFKTPKVSGHISVRGVTVLYNYNDPTGKILKSGSTDALSAFGGGAALSGSFQFLGDNLVYQVAAGNGIGRYLLNLSGAPQGLYQGGTAPSALTHFPTQGGAVLDPTKNQINLVPGAGYHIGFTHVWRKTGFRSSIAWAQTFTINPDTSKGFANVMTSSANQAGNLAQASTHQLFVNSFWNFIPGASVGLEYSYGQWISFARRGTDDKILPVTGKVSPTSGDSQTGTQHRLEVLFSYSFF